MTAKIILWPKIPRPQPKLRESAEDADAKRFRELIDKLPKHERNIEMMNPRAVLELMNARP